MPGVTTCGICGRRINGHPPRAGDVPTAYYANGFARHPHCVPIESTPSVVPQQGLLKLL